MPWQARWIFVIGVPSAIACFLVWFLTFKELSAVETIGKTLNAHVGAAAELAETLKKLEQDHRDSNYRLEGYMRLMCVQAAKNPQDRRECLSVR